MSEEFREQFMLAAEEWLCDDYFADIRFIARKQEGQSQLLQASILLMPLPFPKDNSLHIDSEVLEAGQVHPQLTKAGALEVLENAVNGEISACGKNFCLRGSARSYYSDMIRQDRWYSDLHLKISASVSEAISGDEATKMNNVLRTARIPFDGLSNLVAWLQLPDPQPGGVLTGITIRLAPPVDELIDKSTLVDGRFKLSLRAHPNLDTNSVGVAIWAVPGAVFSNRRQIADSIKWSASEDDTQIGVAEIELPEAEGVLAMLTLSGSTVRRQWHVDPFRARNIRYLATQSFDQDLKRLKQDLFETTDSLRFEKAVGALLFVLGFTPALQPETEAPDLIVATPNGRLVLVECTLGTKDISAKVGKLVDRRATLIETLRGSNHSIDVSAALVCRVSSEKVAAHSREIQHNNVRLISREQLNASFLNLRNPKDPDALVAELNAPPTIVED